MSRPLAPDQYATGTCYSSDDIDAWNTNATVTFDPYAGLSMINADGSIPSSNLVSQYASAIHVIVSPVGTTHFTSVFLTVWAVGWNNGTLSSTLPTSPGIWPMPINQTTGVATGMLNDMKYFPNGAKVYFNLTVFSEQSAGSAIYSPCPAQTSVIPSWGNRTYPTWAYTVGGGWPSPFFSNDIKITAFPNIFAGVYPSVLQPVQLTLTSIGGIPIGGANVNYTLNIRNMTTGATTVLPGDGSEYANRFTPANSSTETLVGSSQLGPFSYSPYNQTTVQFHIYAWEMWSGGMVNAIDSYNQNDQYYSYTITAGGSYCAPNATWASDVMVTTTPYANISTPGSNVQIPAMTTIVNVTIENTNANTTIAYAFLYFNETYQGKTLTGQFLMTAYNSTTQYSGTSSTTGSDELGPYLPGVSVKFYMLSTDGLKCSLQSPTYGFYTANIPPPPVDNKSYFYIVAFDEGTGTYAVGAQVLVSNASGVLAVTQTNSLGFAYPNESASSLPLYLPMGQVYFVNVTYQGSTQTANYLLTATSNKTLTFYFDSTHTVPTIYATSAPVVDVPLVAGLVAASACVIPIYLLWREMRRRAKEEEKRITL
jgi:hypothetical protein